MRASCSLALAAFALSGCFSPTWPAVRPGVASRDDTVILAGSVVLVPAPDQNANYGAGSVMLVGEQRGNLVGLFTADLSQAWHASASSPLSDYWSAWLPVQGEFFIEVPRMRSFHLRGVTYATRTGGVSYELPARIEVQPRDRVVYVGEIRLVRTGKRRVTVNDRSAEARTAAATRGLERLAAQPWSVRLADVSESR